MSIFSLFACVAGLGAVIWIVFNLAVYAAPFFVGLSAGFAALHAGVGPFDAMAIGLVAGVIALAVIRLTCSAAPWLGLRFVMGVAFLGSATLAGWFAGRGLAPDAFSGAWRLWFAVLGAIATGAAASLRLASWGARPLVSGAGAVGPGQPWPGGVRSDRGPEYREG